MPSMIGWEAVVYALKAEGVPYFFGLPEDPRHLYARSPPSRTAGRARCVYANQLQRGSVHHSPR
jgi:hypothetical protein